MPNKVDKEIKLPTIQELRQSLPAHYRIKLLELLPDMNLKQIEYAMSDRCNNLNLIEKVYNGLCILAQIEQKRQEKLTSIRGS